MFSLFLSVLIWDTGILPPCLPSSLSSHFHLVFFPHPYPIASIWFSQLKFYYPKPKRCGMGLLGARLEGPLVKGIFYTLTFSIHWLIHPHWFKHQFYTCNSQFVISSPGFFSADLQISLPSWHFHFRYVTKQREKGATLEHHFLHITSNMWKDFSISWSQAMWMGLYSLPASSGFYFSFCFSLLFWSHGELNHCTCKWLYFKGNVHEVLLSLKLGVRS